MPAEVIEYELYSPRPLPLVNRDKCIKHTMFGPSVLKRVNRVAFVCRRSFTIVYLVGVTLAIVSLFAQRRYRTLLTALSVPMQAVPSAFTFLFLRYDVVALLVCSYEFWYFALTCVAASTYVAFAVHDSRALVVATVCGTFVLTLLMDANFRATKSAAFSSAFGALFSISYTVGFFLELVPDLHYVALGFDDDASVVQVDNVVAGLLWTLLVLSLRTGYRKHKNQNDCHDGMIVCCSYQCPVALRRTNCIVIQSQSLSSVRSSSALQNDRSPSVAAVSVAGQIDETTMTRFEFVPIPERFRSTETVLHGGLSVVTRPWQIPISVFAAVASVIVTYTTEDHQVVQDVAGTLAISFAGLVFLSSLAQANRQLLRRLMLSFDFLFVSYQISAIHVCIAIAVGWSSTRALAVAATWLLLHWVLMQDTVLPVFKSSWIKYQRAIIASLLVAYIGGQVVIMYFLIVQQESSSPTLPDHVLFDFRYDNKIIELRLLSVLVGRIVAMLPWSIRLTWRLWNQRGVNSQLLMLQGKVRYANRAPTSIVPVES